MTVLVKQAFYFQNFQQFCERPSVAVVPVFITLVFSGQDIGIIHEPLILTNVRCCINRAFPTDLSEMKRETGGQRYHVVAEAVRASVTIEVLKGGRAGEFQHGTYSFGNPIFSLYAIRNSKGIIPVRGIVQQADTGKGSKIPAYLFLPGISAAKDIPQQIRMDMVVVLIGQCSIFELHTAVIDTCADGRSEPFSDCETVRGFQASEEVFAAERCAEKGGRTPGNTDKPVASQGCRKYHSVKIDGLYRLQFLRDIIVRCMLYSIHLYGLYTCLRLQRAKHGQYKKDLFRHIPMILFVILFDL